MVLGQRFLSKSEEDSLKEVQGGPSGSLQVVMEVYLLLIFREWYLGKGEMLELVGIRLKGRVIAKERGMQVGDLS